MKFVRTVMALIMTFWLLAPLTACHEKGPAEKAGEKIDSAAEDAKEKMHDLQKEISHKLDDAEKSSE